MLIPRATHTASTIRVLEVLCLRRLVLEEVLNGFIGNHTLIEGVRTLSVLHHLDDLCVATAIGLTRLQGCDCFLCHRASVFI